MKIDKAMPTGPGNVAKRT